MPLFTTAYAGSSKLDKELAAHNLDQLLPDNLGMVYIPEGEIPRRKFPGLTGVVEWLTKEVGTEGTIPVPDLIEALLSRKEYEEDGKTKHDDIVLVMLFDPETEEDVELARAAHEAGIKVVDLCSAGDDVLLDDAVVTFEEEPADETAEEPPFEGGHPIGATPLTPGEQVQVAHDAGVAAAAIRQSAANPGVVLNIQLNIAPEHVANLAQAIVLAMGQQATVTMAAAEEVRPGQTDTPSNVTPIRGTATGEQPAGTKPYYFNSEEGTYRPSRGMARKSETKVFLTPEEVQQVKDSKLLA